jgi:hypothetical protein
MFPITPLRHYSVAARRNDGLLATVKERVWYSLRFYRTHLGLVSAGICMATSVLAQDLTDYRDVMPMVADKRLSIRSLDYSYLIRRERLNETHSSVDSASVEAGRVAFDFDEGRVYQEKCSTPRTVNLNDPDSEAASMPPSRKVQVVVGGRIYSFTETGAKKEGSTATGDIDSKFVQPELFMDMRAFGFGFVADVSNAWPAERTLSNYLRSLDLVYRGNRKGLLVFENPKVFYVVFDSQKDFWVTNAALLLNGEIKMKSDIRKFKDQWLPRFHQVQQKRSRVRVWIQVNALKPPAELFSEEALKNYGRGITHPRETLKAMQVPELDDFVIDD